ncbi:MAG TPA: nucleotidyl transferase AbiEii/AbiGii toxin family protein [Mycobacteriales bacterium]|nr:nucleotidyl transferase AbiEii/AbiGii toxin family protein [Mycobacteriales bacterium]
MTSFVDKILHVDRALDDAEIEHAFGGAICLGYHTDSPRATVDIDLNISLVPAEARLALQSLPRAVAWDSADVEQIERDGQARVFWEHTPIDLFFPQHELHEALRERVERVPFGGATIPILSATDLAVFKALFDRPKDWVDIAEMLSYGEVDAAAVRKWLVRMIGAKDRRVAKWDSALT